MKAFKGIKKKEKIFDLTVLKKVKLLKFGYKSPDVTDEEVKMDEGKKKIKWMWAKILPELMNVNYFRLCQGNFYTELKNA